MILSNNVLFDNITDTYPFMPFCMKGFSLSMMLNEK